MKGLNAMGSSLDGSHRVFVIELWIRNLTGCYSDRGKTEVGEKETGTFIKY